MFHGIRVSNIIIFKKNIPPIVAKLVFLNFDLEKC